MKQARPLELYHSWFIAPLDEPDDPEVRLWVEENDNYEFYTLEGGETIVAITTGIDLNLYFASHGIEIPD